MNHENQLNFGQLFWKFIISHWAIKITESKIQRWSWWILKRWETKAPKKDHFDLENDTGRVEIGNIVEKGAHKRTHRHAHTTHTYIFIILEKKSSGYCK